jgi:hypothetical protein
MIRSRCSRNGLPCVELGTGRDWAGLALCPKSGQDSAGHRNRSVWAGNVDGSFLRITPETALDTQLNRLSMIHRPPQHLPLHSTFTPSSTLLRTVCVYCTVLYRTHRPLQLSLRLPAEPLTAPLLRPTPTPTAESGHPTPPLTHLKSQRLLAAISSAAGEREIVKSVRPLLLLNRP